MPSLWITGVVALGVVAYFALRDRHAPAAPPGAPRGAFMFDAEAIAEGDAGRLVAVLAPYMRERMPHVVQDVGGDGTPYEVVVDGRAFLIVGPADLDDPRLWEIATARAFAMLDALLEAAGRPERAYWLDGAEDGVGAIWTPAQAAGRGGKRARGDRFDAV